MSGIQAVATAGTQLVGAGESVDIYMCLSECLACGVVLTLLVRDQQVDGDLSWCRSSCIAVAAAASCLGSLPMTCSDDR